MTTQFTTATNWLEASRSITSNAHDWTLRLPTLELEVSDNARTTLPLRRSSKQTGTVVTEEHKAGLASAEQEVENAHEVVRMVKAEFDAAKLHETIARYAEVAKAVGAAGHPQQDARGWVEEAKRRPTGIGAGKRVAFD